MHFNIETVRKLARSDKWQHLYRKSKEIGGVRLFRNEYDFTDLQLAFLRWLEIYYILEKDILEGRKFIDMEIINDDIRTDAYLHIRKDLIEQEKESPKKKKNKKAPDPSRHSVVFKRG